MAFIDARKAVPAATQGTAFQNDQLGGVIIRANNPSQSKTQDTGDTAKRRLRIVQAELRSITGTLVKDETDRLRRMALWREFDALIRARDEAR